MKKIELKDLLKDNVYIKLEEEYRQKLFNNFLKNFKNKKSASKFLNLSGSCYIKYYQDNKFDCPLKIIYKISKYVKEDIKNIEKNTKSIKASYYGKGIKNPKFPMTINTKLAKILGNLVGDGCITYHKDSLRVYYTNTNKILIKTFQKTIKEYFGDVNTSITDNNIYLPKILGKILLKFVNKKELKIKIPNVILKANKEIQSKFLRALFEDDGSALLYDYTPSGRVHRIISLVAGSQNLLNQVYKILLNFEIRSSIVWEKRNNYRLQILDRESIFNFNKFIGFTKGYYKQETLNKIVKSYKQYISTPLVNKGKIISLLSQEGPLNTREISENLQLTKRNTLEHLKHLRNTGIVQSKHNIPLRNSIGQIKTNFYYNWCLK